MSAPRNTAPRNPAPRRIDFIVETVLYLNTEARRLAREQCQKFGVTATQLSVLKLLYEIDQLSLSELGRRLAAQNSTVTGIVDRMVQAGLVLREQSATDRRVWHIKLTPRGLTIASQVDAAPWDLLRQGLAALAPAELETLLALLTKISTHVRTHVAPAAAPGENDADE